MGSLWPKGLITGSTFWSTGSWVYSRGAYKPGEAHKQGGSIRYSLSIVLGDHVETVWESKITLG